MLLMFVGHGAFDITETTQFDCWWLILCSNAVKPKTTTKRMLVIRIGEIMVFMSVFVFKCMLAYFYIFCLRKSAALIATTTVLTDISTAAIAGSSSMPLNASTPAARGSAIIL